MPSFVDRHRSKLLALATVGGVTALIWLDAQKGRLPDGTQAPAVVLELLGDDRHLQLADLRGQPVVLDFWATWCGPCRKTLPEVDALAAKYANKVHFFAVNSQDEESAKQEAFRREVGLKLPIVAAGAYAAKLFQVEGLPTTVILDRDGKVVRTLIGSGHTGALEHVLDDLL